MPKITIPPHSSIRIPAGHSRRIAEHLLLWFDKEKRDLPWRRTRDPYAVLVSEFMLQQTQVATVIPYYERFLEAFPTVQALAESSEQEVLRLWAGLGYYSRASHLRAAAQKITVEYGGRVPARVGDLLFLPGVGTYVAGAVASIAYDVAAPAVDANAARVLSRLFAMAGSPSTPRIRRDLEALSLQIMPADRPGDFNQALMELGARICTAAKVRCEICPVRTWCMAASQGNPLDYPQPSRKPPTIEIEEACAVVRRQKPGKKRGSKQYLVARRPGDAGRYRNMWEFPHLVISGGKDKPGRKQNDQAASRIIEHLKDSFGISIRIEEEWAEIRHQVTHHKIRKRVFLCVEDSANARQSFSGNPAEQDAVRWATLEEIGRLPLGAPHKRILALLEENERFFSP